MQKVLNICSVRASRLSCTISAALLIVIILAFANSGQIRNYAEYYRWRSEQIEILKIHVASGNGLAPEPELNSKYERLVTVGPKIRPFLVTQLQQLSNQPYQEEAPYLSPLPRYLAYAIIDISGWSRQDGVPEQKL
jgi:hypothetical protein